MGTTPWSVCEVVSDRSTILILDFSSETNIGDIALQEGLISLLRRHYPGIRLTATTIFGANQTVDTGKHFQTLFLKRDIEVGGALRPTFYPVGELPKNIYLFELLNILGLLFGLLWAMLLNLFPVAAGRILPANYRKTLSLLQEADFIVWKGKNFRNTSWLIEPYRVMSRLYMPIVCHILGKPMACVGVSVWPLTNVLSRTALRAVLSRCVHISVRERASAEALETLFKDAVRKPEIAHYPDLSFALLREQAPKSPPVADAPLSTIALTLVDWTGSGLAARERYIDALVALVEHGVEKYGAEFVVVPQVTKTWEAADYIAEQILSRVNETTRGYMRIAEAEHGVEGVLAIYEKADFLIATRMHSAIFALAVGTPVIAIPYDDGAKWGILDDLGAGAHRIPYYAVTSEALIAEFEAVISNRSAYMTEVNARVREQVALVDQCVLGFRSVMLRRVIGCG